MQRDRTASFLKMRAEKKEEIKEDHSAEIVEIRQLYMQKIDNINSILSEYDKMSGRMTIISDTNLKAHLDEMNSISDKVRDKIVKVKSELIEYKKRIRDEVELNLWTYLIDNLKSCAIKFEKGQAAAKEKIKDRMIFTYRVLVQDSTKEEAIKAIESGQIVTYSSTILDKKHVSAIGALGYIENLHGDIVILETKINELHNLFLDMSILTAEQENTIDQVHQNIDKANHNIEEGLKQVSKAKSSQKSSRKKLLCLVVILIIILIICTIGVLIYIFK